MLIRSCMLALIAGSCSISVAAAQSVESSAHASVPTNLGALIHPGVSQGMGRLSSATTATAALGTGWNLRHCQSSAWYTPDGSNNYLFAFNWEGDYFYTLNNTYLANTLLHACDQGQQYGVYSSNGTTFYEVWTKW
jgi:hypothetical protein